MSTKRKTPEPFDFKNPEYTEQDYHNEGCCWDYPRDMCPGKSCLCVCHKHREIVRE